ncbi:thiamine phosphate synthase [Candidatus Margulisiibacteriota bacterium]
MFEYPFLYPILDIEVSRSGDCEQDFIEACKSGIKIIQLRAKKVTHDKYKECAEMARQITKENGVKLIINDWPDIAKEVDADGVHVGQSDMAITSARQMLGPDKIVGGSAENLEQALKAEQAGADYVGVGAIFRTATKEDIGVLGVSKFKEITKKVKIPVIAIGGVTSKNFTRVLDAGAKSVAVISDIFLSENINKKIKEYEERYKEYARRIDY